MQSNNSGFNPKAYYTGSLYSSTQDYTNMENRGEYLPHETEPKDRTNNSDNLFHDSNSQNGKWLKQARAYLARSR